MCNFLDSVDGAKLDRWENFKYFHFKENIFGMNRTSLYKLKAYTPTYSPEGS